MIKLIASDIDETLVDQNKKVPQKNKEAIEKAKEKGLIVMLATGRGPHELNEIPEDAGVIEDDRFIICCNGAIIVSAKEREVVSSLPIEFKYAKAIFDYCKENNLTFFVYTLDEKYAINLDPLDKINESKNYGHLMEIDDGNIDFLKDKIIPKVIIKNTNIDFLHAIEVDIAKITSYDVEIAYSSDMYMEINAKGVDKGLALKKVCDYYRIDMKEALAIGDNYNDVAMLEKAGTSVAVANAHLQVKEVADYVTKATNIEGAVGEAIEKFVLNN